MLFIIPSAHVFGGSSSQTEIEPELFDNEDGNWTAVWSLENPNNYSTNNIDIINERAVLHKQQVSFVENSIDDFRNGTWDKLAVRGNNGIGLDLKRDKYILIADMKNHRAVEIDFDEWYWQYGSNSSSGGDLNELVEPGFACRLVQNRTLITDTKNDRVIEVGRNSEFYWQYGSNDSSGMGNNSLYLPLSAVPMSNGNILIADSGNNWVVEVRRNKTWAWQYGILDMVSPGISNLNKPAYAEELDNGNILITDMLNHRVIEVNKGKSLLWQYGTGLPGFKSGKIDMPTYATRLNSGYTLIADMNNHRVIEVDSAGIIRWQYGKDRISGCDVGELDKPQCAVRLNNGNTLISDTGNHRVIEVNIDKKIVWQYGMNETPGPGSNHLDTPRSALPIPKSHLIGSYLSKVFDGGSKTNWTTIYWNRAKPPNTYLMVYTRSGESPNYNPSKWSDWSNAYTKPWGDLITSPDNRYIQYSVVFVTFDMSETSSLIGVMINGTKFAPAGELTTESFRPSGLLKWGEVNWNVELNGQTIKPWYSTSGSGTWLKIPLDRDLSFVSIEEGGIKFRFDFSTSDTSISPELHSFSFKFERLGELAIIEILPDPVDVIAGKEFTFNATGYDTYGREVEISPTWSTTVGQMNEGVFTAQTTVGAGFVNASDGNVVGSATVNIIPGPLDHIIVKPSLITIIAGETEMFKAFGYDEFDIEIPINPEWKTDVGVMEGDMLIAQNFAGRGTVKAMVDNIVGIAEVTIKLNETTHHRPKILSKVPDQVRPEDSQPWTLNLASYEHDDEDPNEKLLWYISDVNKSLCTVTGAYSPEDVLTFIPRPNGFGNNKATLWLVDSDNMTANQPLWINITPVNDLPVINEIPDLKIHYNDPYVFDYSSYVHDIETPNDQLVLDIKEPQGQAYTTVNGLNVTYNYPSSMFGKSVTLSLTVSDGEANVEDIFELSITDNHAPVLAKALPTIYLAEGETKYSVFDLDEYFTDQDNDPLEYFFSAQYIGVNIHANSTVTFSSTGSWSGKESITFRAMDPYGSMAEGALEVIVNEINDPPTIAPLPELYVHYDYDYEFNLSQYVSDPDNETHELSIQTSDITHISFNSEDNMKMILHYPENLLGQTFNLILYVSDGIDSTPAQFRVHITDNFPPILDKILADINFDEDESLINAFDLTKIFLDWDDAVLDFTYQLLDEENITININENNTVDFSSKQDWFGGSYVTFRAEDHTGAFVESSFDIVVIPVNDAPIIQPIPVQQGKVGERWVLDLTPYLSDVDDDASELEVTIDDKYARMVTITGKQLTFHTDKPLNEDIEFTVSDGYKNQTGTLTLKVTGEPENELITYVWILVLIIILIIFMTAMVLVRKRHGKFIVTDVFVIHKSGLLIKYKGDTLGQDSDEDIISGMLSAVQSFISESFANSSKKENDDWKLNQLKMGGHEIMIERGSYVFIAIIYEGIPGKRLPKLLSDLVSKVEDKYGSVLDNWSGNYKQVEGIEDIIVTILTTKQSKPISTVSQSGTVIQINTETAPQPSQLPSSSPSPQPPQLPSPQAQLPPASSPIPVESLPIQKPLLPPKPPTPKYPVKQPPRTVINSPQPSVAQPVQQPTQQVLTATPYHITQKLPKRIMKK
jgi:hypothetical protein